MELERVNLERDPEAEEEERGEGGRRGCCACVNCDRLHGTVSKWMLPEDARGTYLERANCIPPPIFILAISAAELAVFIYYAVWKPQTQWITLGTGISESPLIYTPDKRQEAWRFLTYMFLHAGIEHILGNLFLQLVLGIPLELVHKGHRVGLVYIAGVLGGSLASSIFDPRVALVGASGGVYALIGGYFMNVVVVSFVAHLAGGLTGMSIGYVIFSSFDKNFIKDPRFWVSIIAYLVFVGFAVFFNVFFSPANQ